MAINTTRLSTGLGKIFGGANEINTYRGTTVPTRVTTLISQLSTATNDILTGIYDARASAKSSEAGWMSYLQQLTSQLIIDEVNLDRNIPTDSLTEALTEWKRQMLLASDTFNDSPVTITPASIGSPTEVGYTVIVTDKDGTGVAQDMIVPDVYLLQVSADKDHGGTRWAETVSIQGKQADTDVLSDTYPTGTGIVSTLTIHDPAAGTGIVSDPGFNLWTTNTPQKWTLGPSTVAGTHVFKGADDPRDGAAGSCLDLKGDGVVIPKLRQTLTGVVANQVVPVHYRVKKVADPGTDWGVTVRLVDSTGAALTGPAAYSNAVATVTCGSLNSNWTNVQSGYFILPNNLPADGVVILEIVFHQFGSITTAPVNTAEVYVDHVDVWTASPLYNGGPLLEIASGTTSAVDNDAWTVTIALASGSMSSYMIRWLDRMLGLKTLGIRMPTVSGGTETQSDSLIS